MQHLLHGACLFYKEVHVCVRTAATASSSSSWLMRAGEEWQLSWHRIGQLAKFVSSVRYDDMALLAPVLLGIAFALLVGV